MSGLVTCKHWEKPSIIMHEPECRQCRMSLTQTSHKQGAKAAYYGKKGRILLPGISQITICY